MESWLEARRTLLSQRATKVLQENVGFNRSGLPPFRLPQVAQQIVSGLDEFLKSDSSATATAAALGERLGKQGLGLRSLLAVKLALVREGLQRPTDALDADLDVEKVAQLDHFLTTVLEGLVNQGFQAVTVQRDEMQAALAGALQNREAELRQVIQELSTPVMPVYDQILVLPLIGNIDTERSNKITERLLNEVTQRRARIVIIDITGVPTIDEVVAAALMRTARAVQLLGTRPVLVGVRPELARVLTQLGVDLEGLVTLANLQGGIEWALRQQEMTIQRLPQSRTGHPATASSPEPKPAAPATVAGPSKR